MNTKEKNEDKYINLFLFLLTKNCVKQRREHCNKLIQCREDFVYWSSFRDDKIIKNYINETFLLKTNLLHQITEINQSRELIPSFVQRSKLPDRVSGDLETTHNTWRTLLSQDLKLKQNIISDDLIRFYNID